MLEHDRREVQLRQSGLDYPLDDRAEHCLDNRVERDASVVSASPDEQLHTTAANRSASQPYPRLDSPSGDGPKGTARPPRRSDHEVCGGHDDVAGVNGRCHTAGDHRAIGAVRRTRRRIRRRPECLNHLVCPLSPRVRRCLRARLETRRLSGDHPSRRAENSIRWCGLSPGRPPPQASLRLDFAPGPEVPSVSPVHQPPEWRGPSQRVVKPGSSASFRPVAH
jgi:hypothetical protein